MQIDFGYVDYNNLENEHPDLVPIVFPDDGHMDLERLFHSMSQKQLELMVCLYLGLSGEEIVKVLDYPNIVYFYNANARLRDFYIKQKPKLLAII